MLAATVKKVTWGGTEIFQISITGGGEQVASFVPTVLIKLSLIVSWIICSKRWRTWSSWRSPLIVNSSPRLQCVDELPLLLELLALRAKRFVRIPFFRSGDASTACISPSLVGSSFLNACLFRLSSSQECHPRRVWGLRQRTSSVRWIVTSVDHSWDLSAHTDLTKSLVLCHPGSAKCLLGEISVCCYRLTDGSQQVNQGLLVNEKLSFPGTNLLKDTLVLRIYKRHLAAKQN